MSNYKGHLAGGLFAYFITLFIIASYYVYPALPTAAEWLLFALAGSLFPDVDVKSKGQNYFYWLIFVLLAYLFLMQRFKLMAITGVIAVIPQLVRHRGIFHRIWFIILLPICVAMGLCLYIPSCKNIIFFDALFFIVGALSHLWLDLGLRRMFRG